MSIPQSIPISWLSAGLSYEGPLWSLGNNPGRADHLQLHTAPHIGRPEGLQHHVEMNGKLTFSACLFYLLFFPCWSLSEWMVRVSIPLLAAGYRRLRSQIGLGLQKRNAVKKKRGEVEGADGLRPKGSGECGS